VIAKLSKNRGLLNTSAHKSHKVTRGWIMIHIIRRFAGLVLVSAVSFSAVSVNAQEDTGVFEEIIVTTQKRQESLQDVPISLSVVSGEQLVDDGIYNLDMLAPYVPNFSKGESGVGPIIRIRGIATGSNPAFEQSVVLYADDISLSRAPLARLPFMDLSRVEVLRGPQNVLFGKNAIAGAISMVSAMPTDEFEGNAYVRYEPEYEDTEVFAVVSGPLSENVRGRLAVRYAELGGYFEEYSNETGNDQVKLRDEEQREDISVRGTLAWDIGNSTEIILRAEHNKIESTGQNHELIFGYANPFPASATNPLGGMTYTQSVAAIQGAYNAAIAAFQLPPVDVGTDTIEQNRIRRSPFDGYQDLDANKLDLTINHEFDAFMLTSVTGYVEYEEGRLAGGGSSGIDISSILTDESFDQISQEFRLTSDAGRTIDWIAGVYFQKWDLDTDESTLLDEMNMPVLLGISGAAPGFQAVANLDSTRTFVSSSITYAAFGQLTWNVSDRTRISLGGRYTVEDKDAQKTVDIINSSTGEFDITQAIFASCGFGVDYQTLGAISAVVPLPGCAGEAPALGAFNTHTVDAERSENAFTPSLVVEFDIGDSNMLYGSASTGFKAGGFDARAAREANLEYEDENVTGIEAGLKSRFAGGKVETNVALFYSEYEDLQVSTFDGVAGFVVGNAAEFTAQGVEMDGRWRVTDALTLSGALAWTDTEWTKYEDATCNSMHRILTGEQLCDRTGLAANNTPEWSGNLIADYYIPIGSSMSFRTTFEALYEGEYFTESTREIGTMQDANTILNLRLALEGERWTFAILGKNLTDEVVIDFSSEVALSGSDLLAPTYYGYLRPPRTIAAQFGYNF
jgi:iron complex outermembrane receptor protein